MNTTDARQLCSTCKDLDLSIDKFVISNTRISQTRESASNSATPLSGGATSEGGHLQLNSGNASRVFAKVVQVQDRRNICQLCHLAWQAVCRYSGTKVDGNTNLLLTWEVDGRQSTPSDRVINRTRRIRLSWREKTGKIEMVYLVFVARTAAGRSSSDAYAGQAKDTHFLGRGLGNSKERQALMKSWIDLCVEKHGPNCQNKHGTRSEFKKLIDGTYFGVIDVIDMQLKQLPMVNGKPEKYVALSYVWGKRPVDEKPYTTMRTNVMLRIQHGGLEKAWDRLPRTIQDAILLISRLGERYVWIDSLCIVQDSNSSWELNAKAMHLVYGNAHFTICAADGDAEAGLRAVDPILRLSTANAPRMTTDEIREKLRATEDTHLPPLTAECLPGVRLLVSRPPEAVIQDSPWSQRGWTFQERLLSRRCLIFAEGQVYFQCRSTVISQHIFTDGSANGWSLDWTNSPLRTLGELRRRAFWFYMKCIQLYTGRELTKPKDILTAFQGTGWLLQQQMSAPLFYGLPSSHFDLALLWMPLKKLDRRRQKTAHRSSAAPCSQDEMGNCNCKLEEEGFGGKDFPSWSWCGWMGGKAEYQLSMIDGCLLNVQEWLRDHTWIQWYVRDYEGNLRPLWNKAVLREDQSEEVRWRGYAGKAKNSVKIQSESERPRTRHHRPPRRPSPPLGYRPRSPPPMRSSTDRYQDTPYYALAPGPGPNYHNPFRPGRESPPPAVGADFPTPGRPSTRRHRVKPDEWSKKSNADYLQHLTSGSTSTDSDEYSEEWDESATTRSSLNSNSDDDASDQTENGRDYYDATATSKRNEDAYGRPIRAALKGRNTSDFTGILPDNPFGIIRGPFPNDSTKDQIRAMPILQFWTWRTELLVTIRRDSTNGDSSEQGNTTTTTNAAAAPPGSGLCQCNVVDKAGDWCGSIVLPARWAGEREGTPLMFIAVSDAKSLTADECPVWNYYIPKEKDESEWDLYYVMLLERNRGRALWERVAVGKVFQAAFGDAVWDEIKLG
ncbi:heterokaryon incompatibility protein-domain-containing protein [Podospora appendiculata]|uniref:Heterokaryon incompatibility protein-domain-containing protein n=1 Tax=Podospora appendiculata TaxID=314037 RepID=A0AAE0XB54_9PEZI|nr:heterokaryon incompatibility protein-domain-containing protein [Podospora appendiculata]